jgi:DNA sulfur modification protein DndE
LFKPLGIELGVPWDRSKLGPGVISAMSQAASEIGTILAHLSPGQFYKGAEIPPPAIGDFGTDYKTRAVIARVGLTANQPSEAIYWIYTHDKNGDLLTGEKKYTMTFTEAVPFEKPGFWSITLYDSRNNYTVANSIHRYMLGSDTEDLKKNSDGSFTIYIQKLSPGKDKESNWLPTPVGDFYLIPRSYPPTQKILNLLTDVTSWPIPSVDPVP